ncbi:DUF3887 domain-containing protein [Streptomyces sp. NPDC046759]|uniref:DUF3887 domain-containing protein n=1 Tax=Streptomyces sp. NPDC046759 TaxID=3155019 RepID=UPI00340409DF
MPRMHRMPITGMPPVRGRRRVRTAATVAPAAAALLPATVSAAAAPRDDTVALRTLDAVVKGDYTAATVHFDAAVRRQLPPDTLEKAWSSFQGQYGRYESHRDPKDAAVGGYTVVSVPLRMERGPAEFRVSFDKGGSVAGLFFRKPGVPLS